LRNVHGWPVVDCRAKLKLHTYSGVTIAT
jgi:hypothetical protein